MAKARKVKTMNKMFEDILDNAETAKEAIKLINAKCETCYARSCVGCTWSDDDIIRQLWKERHPKTVVQKNKRLKVVRKYNHRDGNNAVKTLNSLQRRLYSTVNTGEKPSEVFLALAHKHGVPEEITTVDEAKEYANNHTARYKRNTIAYYMMKEYNTSSEFKRRGYEIFRRK